VCFLGVFRLAVRAKPGGYGTLDKLGRSGVQVAIEREKLDRMVRKKGWDCGFKAVRECPDAKTKSDSM
jgi:hypothetical protein